jgi:hypothetical protein
MATIYRFVIEQQQTQSKGRKDGSDTGLSKKGAAKKGKYVTIFGPKGGVEHNRKLRAINPLINKITHGYWEKGMRLGRAAGGIAKFDAETGKFAGISGVAIVIIIQMIIQGLMKWQQMEMQRATKLNAQNYKQLENGVGAIHGEYKVSTAFWTGRHTYDQNK